MAERTDCQEEATDHDGSSVHATGRKRQSFSLGGILARHRLSTTFIRALGSFTHMRVAILGNSGSGKSILAKRLAAAASAPMLDLDTIVWEPNVIAVPRPEARVLEDLEKFCNAGDRWIIEGCYADVIRASLRWEPELVFLNPGEEVCLRHCRERPWEPHKYASKAEQDANLAFLLSWVSDYYRRDGSMSLRAHREVFAEYAGRKREVTVCD